ncbi:hypothetical protein GCM10029964_060480 [Kibdelosporangium lantanae]
MPSLRSITQEIICGRWVANVVISARGRTYWVIQASAGRDVPDTVITGAAVTEKL